MTKQHVCSQVPGNTVDENLEIKHSFITKLFLGDSRVLARILKMTVQNNSKSSAHPDLGT